MPSHLAYPCCPTRTQTATQRRTEAERAAEVLHAELIWVGEPDGFLYDIPRNRSRVIDVFRQTRPDIVFAHHPLDYHPDHPAASELVSAARLLAREKLVESRHEPLPHVPPLFFMDTLGGAGAPVPELLVDVGAVLPYKAAMLEMHKCQNDSRRSRKGEDYLDMMRGQSRLRGREAGVEHAEALYPATHPLTSVEQLQPRELAFRIPVIAGRDRFSPP